ncbi:MAG: hypothetical protein KC441_05890 [Anaerolineales bacterium]|nr:hypothetical protein [Anaerolineales bacterium]
MTRFWPEGLPILVAADAQERPYRFTWQGRSHQVVYIAQQWRVDTGWWRSGGDNGDGRVWRAYYKLTTDTGLLLILFQDLSSGEWFLQRLYD